MRRGADITSQIRFCVTDVHPILNPFHMSSTSGRPNWLCGGRERRVGSYLTLTVLVILPRVQRLLVG
ncbi:hypothetical protein LINPERHAP1_LOCUS2426 [Linum perenne]